MEILSALYGRLDVMSLPVSCSADESSLFPQTARYSALIAGIIYGKRRYGEFLSAEY